MTKTIRMQCADEGFVEREFQADGEGDYVCLQCGWMQTSAAAGARELCNLATWSSLEGYQKVAAIARAGGLVVADVPPNRSEDFK